jgi:hypothetical protein
VQQRVRAVALRQVDPRLVLDRGVGVHAFAIQKNTAAMRFSSRVVP